MRYILSIPLCMIVLSLFFTVSHARDDDEDWTDSDAENNHKNVVCIIKIPNDLKEGSDDSLSEDEQFSDQQFNFALFKERDRVSSLVQACSKNILFQTHQTLMLHDQDIFDLPEEESFWNEIATLKELFIFNNSLQRFPVNIRQLKHLKSLYASNNHLSHLPASLGEITALTHIDFSTNDLQELPDTMKHLTQLTDLVLSGNRFRRLPAFIENLPRLERLEVVNNPINDPETLAMLDRLKKRGVKGLSQR